MNPVLYAMIKVLTLYQYAIIVWSFGSFFPQWQYQQWYRMLASIVEPYVNLFRSLKLTVGMFDLAPMVAIFGVWAFQRLLVTVALRF